MGQLEHALVLCTEADEVQRRIRDAVKRKKITKRAPAAMADDALRLGIITASERELIDRAGEARAAVVEVDSFTLEAYADRALDPTVPMGLRRVSDGPPAAATAAEAPAPAREAAGHEPGGTSGDETSAA